MAKKPIPGQLDLLDWTPPAATVRFDDVQVRASTIAQRIGRAVAAALADCGKPRDVIAAEMSAFLGSRVSLDALNACASQAREDYTISAPRLAALIHVTGDRRLLELFAEPNGWAVVERRQLAVIQLAAVRARREDLKKAEAELLSQARRAGAL